VKQKITGKGFICAVCVVHNYPACRAAVFSSLKSVSMALFYELTICKICDKVYPTRARGLSPKTETDRYQAANTLG
jgi:hypothetical protein